MPNLYQDLAQSFSDSRAKPEPGWLPLLELDLPEVINVLDIGCANARFYSFLVKNFPHKQINYTGVDSSNELLQIARETYGDKIKLIQLDLSTQLAELAELQSIHSGGSSTSATVNGGFDLITLHAVMHHIPRLSYRKQMLAAIAAGMQSGSYLHVSFWQFGEYARYQDKINFPAENIGMPQQDLEERDFVMSWQRDGLVFRFCHWANAAELKIYDQQLQQQNLDLVKDYRADGREGNQNWYWLWRRH